MLAILCCFKDWAEDFKANMQKQNSTHLRPEQTEQDSEQDSVQDSNLQTFFFYSISPF